MGLFLGGIRDDDPPLFFSSAGKRLTITRSCNGRILNAIKPSSKFEASWSPEINLAAKIYFRFADRQGVSVGARYRPKLVRNRIEKKQERYQVGGKSWEQAATGRAACCGEIKIKKALGFPSAFFSLMTI